MNLRQLEVFLAIADAGNSVTRAAETLHVAQPAASRTLADLEYDLGAPLFERTGRSLRLTAAGERFVGEARRLVEGFREVELGMRTGADMLPLRVGATYTVGTTYLARLLAARAALPGRCPVLVTVRNTHLIEAALVDGTLDAGVVEGAIRAPELVERVVARDEVVAVAAPAVAAKARAGKGPDATVPRIVREPGSGTQETALAAFPVPPGAPVWTVANTQTMIELAAAGLGVAYLSALLVRDRLADGTLARVGRTAAKRTFRLVHHRRKRIDARMERFIADARTLIRL